VKKKTLALQNYEATLLRSYKMYLQKLEQMCKILRRKKGDMRLINEREIQLGEIALTCMCELLTVHPYFNFSINIASYIILFLDNKRSNIREKTMQCVSQVFKEDKRGQLSLTVRIYHNHFISIVYFISLNTKNI
jgi:nucleolar complex protein 3